MTKENWPLIGAAKTPGVFLDDRPVRLWHDVRPARPVTSVPVPWSARRLRHSPAALSLARYEDKALMDELESAESRGLL